jgi:phage host-nuclease inhibitor protein Gam
MSTSTLWRVLWWIIAALFAVSIGVWVYVWWLWQRADPSSFEPWHVLISVVISLITGLLGWLNMQSTSAGQPSILANMVGRLLENLIENWRGLFYRQPYLASLIERVRYYDTSGLNVQGPAALSAEQVYVEPHLKISPAHAIRPSVLTPAERQPDEQRHPVWYYLASTKRRNATTHGPFALLAGPGFGKSTLLRHITQVLSSSRNVRKQHRAPNRLPVLLFLREHDEQIVTRPPSDATHPADSYRRDYTLVAAIADSIDKRGGLPPPRGWFLRQLRNGQCLVLLDGLDEIADPIAQAQVAAWIDHQRRTFYRNQFILTSRPLAYQDKHLEGATTIEVMPLVTDQIQEFVYRWHRADALATAGPSTGDATAAKSTERTADQQAKHLLQRIAQSPALSRLAPNPLLLTMILYVHKYKGEALPDRRITLLAEACLVLLNRRPDPPEFNTDQKQTALLPLAYAMQQQRTTDIDLELAGKILQSALQETRLSNRAIEFLEGVRRGSGLLLIEHRMLLFAHPIFQSYLSACYATRLNLLNDLLTNLDDGWWRETILLYCAQNDATVIVQACLSPVPISPVHFKLAMDCLNEAAHVGRPALESIARIVRQGLDDQAARRIMGKALAEIRQERELRLSETKCVDTGLITHVEYQIFLFHCYERNLFHQPDHWRDLQFPSDQAVLPVTGLRAQDALAFCDWLNEQEGSKAWRYRLPHRTEVEEERPLAALKVPSISFWMVDQQGPICSRPAGLPAFSLEAARRQVLNDVQQPHSYNPAALFAVNTNPLSPSQAIALLAPYDFDRGQLAQSISQAQQRLTWAIQDAASLAAGLQSASREFRRIADEHRKKIQELDRSLSEWQTRLQVLEAQRNGQRQDLVSHYQQQYSKIDQALDQHRTSEKEVQREQAAQHDRVTEHYKPYYATIAAKISEIETLMSSNETITAQNHDKIRSNCASLCHQIEEAIRQVREANRQNEAIRNEAMSKLREHPHDYLRQVLSEVEDTIERNQAVIADYERQRRDFENEEQRRHADEDRSAKESRAHYENVINEYRQQRSRLQSAEKDQHAKTDERANEVQKQIRQAISELEREHNNLRNVERQQLAEVNRHYDPSIQESNTAVKELTQHLRDLAKAEADASNRANHCDGFPSEIVHPLNAAARSLDDFERSSHEFFSNAINLVAEVAGSLSRAITATDELITFLRKITADAASAVSQYQQELKRIHETVLAVQTIYQRRAALTEALKSACTHVENCDLQPIARIDQVIQINRHLHSTLNDIQGYLTQANRKLNLQSDKEQALQRLGYMRLILLTSALCLLIQPELDRFATTRRPDAPNSATCAWATAQRWTRRSQPGRGCLPIPLLLSQMRVSSLPC